MTDTCFLCTCTPTFNGCRTAQETPKACPAVGCASPLCCHNTAECTNIGACAPPGALYGCGVCFTDPGDCTTDSDCSGSQICEPEQCSCVAAKKCVPGCTSDAACDEGTVCSATAHRCVPKACSSTLACPSSFTCSSGGCLRKSCSGSDASCAADGSSFCVSGQCYPGLGICRAPVP